MDDKITMGLILIFVFACFSVIMASATVIFGRKGFTIDQRRIIKHMVEAEVDRQISEMKTKQPKAMWTYTNEPVVLPDKPRKKTKDIKPEPEEPPT